MKPPVLTVLLIASFSSAVLASTGTPGLAILPRRVTIRARSSLRFTAITGLGSKAAFTANNLAWAADGGTIDNYGLYTAGSNPGVFNVVVASGDEHASALVRIIADKAKEPIIPIPEDVEITGHINVHEWVHGALVHPSDKLPSVRIDARVFGATLASVRLYAIDEVGHERLLKEQNCRDRDRVRIKCHYPARGVKWLELRIYDKNKAMMSAVRRIV